MHCPPIKYKASIVEARVMHAGTLLLAAKVGWRGKCALQRNMQMCTSGAPQLAMHEAQLTATYLEEISLRTHSLVSFLTFLHHHICSASSKHHSVTWRNYRDR